MQEKSENDCDCLPECVDVGEAIHRYISSCNALKKCLSTDDGEGGRRWNLHRSQLPYREEFIAMAKAEIEGSCVACLDGFDPYIWYELRDEIDDDCVSGVCLPSIVEFDVEVVAFTLREMKKISRLLKRHFARANSDCGLSCMGGLKVQKVRLYGASDNYEASNQLVSDLGGFVRNYSLEIYPWWW